MWGAVRLNRGQYCKIQGEREREAKSYFVILRRAIPLNTQYRFKKIQKAEIKENCFESRKNHKHASDRRF
jgi:hypothetical protein